jgi:hypothetical protein
MKLVAAEVLQDVASNGLMSVCTKVTQASARLKYAIVDGKIHPYSSTSP